MVKKTWKYSKEKKSINFDEYLVLPEDKKFKITIKNWVFAEQMVEGYGKLVFRTDVIKLDGKDDNRRLVIKNYANVQELKKKLARKTSARDTCNMEITRKYDEDDMDYYFEINFIK